jgi:acyl carrier protein
MNRMLIPIQDRTLDSMTLQDFQVPFKTKVSGTLALQKIFGDKNLDFFIMLSSAANIVGTSGQGNYNAGNAVQDAIAQAAAPNGCHYLAFSPGMIEGTEVIRDNETRVKALSRSGFTSIRQDELDRLLEYILSPDARTDRLPGIIVGFNSESLAQAVSINGNIRSPMFTHVLDSTKHEPKKGNVTKEKSFREILDTGDKEVALSYTITALGKKLSSLISIDPEALDLEKPIFELGLDSLIAIELRNWIKREFEASLQSLEILDEQSVTALSRKIIERSKLVMEGVKNGVV